MVEEHEDAPLDRRPTKRPSPEADGRLSATGELQLPPITIFALTAAASLLVGLRVYGAFRPAPAVAPRGLEPAR